MDSPVCCSTLRWRVQGTIFTKSDQLVCFADDIDVIGRSLETVADQYTRLKREAARIGLKVNVLKTKYMLANRTNGIGPGLVVK